MKRFGIEILSSGAKIDWDISIQINTKSGLKNRQRKINISCCLCGKWRLVNCCALSQYRKGIKKYCWDCHLKILASRNIFKKNGFSKNKQGYIIRYPSSFSKEEFDFILPMFRCDKTGKPQSILEHRAVVALFYKRILNKNEVVHHKNEIKNDNRIENLYILSPKEHHKEHIETLVVKSLQKRIQDLNEELNELKQQS